FAHDQLEGLLNLVGLHAGRDGERSDIVEKSERAANGIGEPVIFTQHLEETRAHVLAKNYIEQTQSEASIIVTRTGTHSQGELSLFDFFGIQADPGFGLL